MDVAQKMDSDLMRASISEAGFLTCTAATSESVAVGSHRALEVAPDPAERDMGAHRPQVEPTGGKRTSAQARCERDEPAREPSERTDAAPNSAQRRSAARMIRFIQAKKGSDPSVGSDPAAPARTSAQTPALVESDERAGAQPMDTTEADEGRQDAVAVEATAPAPTNIGPQGPSQVESTGRDRFSRGGLQPLHVSPEERCRENAANALENQRSARGRG